MRTTLSPGDRLLLASVSPPWSEDDIADLFESLDSEAWNDLFDRASRNRVESFVASLVEDCASAAAAKVDGAVRAQWRARRMRHVFRAELARSLASEIGHVLTDNGVEAIVYKGVEFQDAYYSPDCPRAFGDIDILVRRDDLDRIDGVLAEIGFRRSPAALPLGELSHFHLHAVYGRTGTPFPLELHWAVDSPILATCNPVSALFDRAAASPVFGGLERPSDLDALVLMNMHLIKHLGPAACLPRSSARLKAIMESGGMIWIVDILRWFSLRPQPDPNTLETVLREFGARAAGALGLRLAADLARIETRELVAGFDPFIPSRPPLLTRLLYSDYSTSRREHERGALARRFFLAANRSLGFRLVRVLEALFPIDDFVSDPRASWADRAAYYARLPGFALRTALRLAGARLRARIRGVRR